MPVPMHRLFVLAALTAACDAEPQSGDTAPPSETDSVVELEGGESDGTLPPEVLPTTQVALQGDPVLDDIERDLYSGNHSRLLYAHAVDVESSTVDDPCSADEGTAGPSDELCVDGGTAAPARPSPPPAPDTLLAESVDFDVRADIVWNTREAALSLADIQRARDGAGMEIGLGFQDLPACSPDIDGPREDLYFGSAWRGGMHFMAPNNAFDADGDEQLDLDADELAAAIAFLKGARPHIPFGLPFRDESVALGHGWFYDSGSSHRGLDYSRTGLSVGDDPGFPVVASADGIVRRVMLMNRGGGHTVVIEHPRSDGESLWSLYMHLRNGKTADRTAGAALAAANPGRADCAAYGLAIANPDLDDHPMWGTEAQVLQVREGDLVARGELIGWAGNTGCGGIGGGLESDGTLSSWATVSGNVHLHMYYAKTLPGQTVLNADGTTSDIAVYVDAYGAYSQATAEGCYDLGTSTPYPRIIAPFDPVFHDIPPQIFSQYLGYYHQMGYGPRSISSTYEGDMRVHGAMGPMARNTWAVLIGMPDEDFDTQLTAWRDEGLRLESVHRTSVADGNRWSVTMRTRGTEVTTFDRSLSWDGHVQSWDTLVPTGAMIQEYDRFEVDGDFRTAALWINPGKPFQFYRDRDDLTMAHYVNDLLDDDYHPYRTSVSDVDGTFSTTFVQDDRQHYWATGITGDTVDFVKHTLHWGGFVPVQLESYPTESGVKHAMIWRRPSGLAPDLGFQTP